MHQSLSIGRCRLPCPNQIQCCFGCQRPELARYGRSWHSPDAEQRQQINAGGKDKRAEEGTHSSSVGDFEGGIAHAKNGYRFAFENFA
eukprot:SAG31_NODE_2368_length_5854_cov_19.043440_10_plen_88_part_00